MSVTVAPRLEPRHAATLADVRRTARTLLAVDVAADTPTTEALHAISSGALARLGGEGDEEQARALAALVLRAQDLEDSIVRSTTARRGDQHAEVEQGLARLRQISSSAELLDRVCVELVRSTGFKRCVLSRLEGDTWYPWMAHFSGDPDIERRFVERIRGKAVPMDALPVERAVRDARRPVILQDVLAGAVQVLRPLAESVSSRSYVVAPIVPAGRVVGFLHADHGADGVDVDAVDGEVLMAFADGLGRIYERTVLLERLQAQRARVRETFELAEDIMATISDADIELIRHAEDRLAPPGEHGIAEPGGNAAIDAELTSRERDVLRLMVQGHSNNAIAERLVIKEGTVKSHVKHILRKIGAANRAEAVSRYHGA